IFQHEQKKNVCSGFFIAKCNSATQALFKRVVEDCPNENRRLHDQAALQKNIKMIKWGLFPDNIVWCCRGKQKLYEKHHTIGFKNTNYIVDKNIVAHHANWTSSIENKI